MDTRKLTYKAGSKPYCQAQIYEEDGDGRTVGLTYWDEGGRNAAELVKRWNAYPELVVALDNLIEYAQNEADSLSDLHEDEHGEDAEEAQDLVEKARQLLAKLKDTVQTT